MCPGGKTCSLSKHSNQHGLRSRTKILRTNYLGFRATTAPTLVGACFVTVTIPFTGCDVFSFLPWNEITTATLALQMRPTTWELFSVVGFPYLTPNNKDQTMRHEGQK